MLPVVKHLMATDKKLIRPAYIRIPKLGRPDGQTDHCILRLAESQYIFEKIENN